MSDFKELKHCLCCNGQNLYKVLDLGDQPLANSFFSFQSDLPKFPLELMTCDDCSHLQLSIAVNPDMLFRDYCYVSGTSLTLKEYFDFFSYWTIERYKAGNNFKSAPKTVCDIACNDSTLLDYYRLRGLKTFGVDPAENLHAESLSKGHDVVCDYLDYNIFQDQKFDIVTAQNVLAHTADPYNFLKNCKRILSDNGVLFIQTSQADMVENNEFDTIYHEHVSFFSYQSMSKLCERVGLQIVGYDKFSIHGTSQVFQITHEPKRSSSRLDLYREKVENLKADLVTEIFKKAAAGYKIVGYGAAAKGMTLLGFLDLKFEYIIDDNPLKIGTYTPVNNIPVVGPEVLVTEPAEKILFVPLAWNFYTEIRQRIKNVRNNDQDLFITYFPEVKVEP